jgi:hypothetical protein
MLAIKKMEAGEKRANLAWQRELCYKLWQSGYADQRYVKQKKKLVLKMLILWASLKF